MTLAQLNNPTDYLANVAKTILLADTPVAFPYPVYTHRELIQQNNQCRVEVTCTGAERASDHMDLANIAGTQVPFYNHNRATLAFEVITAVADRGANSNHAYVLGRIGTLCRRDQQKFTTAACGGLVILDLDDRGTTPTENEQTDTDRTRRTYDIEWITPAALYASAT
jgi:hypothetical protein